jgi:hypothetical protein
VVLRPDIEKAVRARPAPGLALVVERHVVVVIDTGSVRRSVKRFKKKEKKKKEDKRRGRGRTLFSGVA